MRTPIEKRTALITGASGGIGRELAKVLAHQRWNLILVARRAEVLAQLGDELMAAHPVQVHVFSADLSQAGAVERLYNSVAEARLTVDALVNNAGVGQLGAFAQLSLEEQLAAVELNVKSLTALTGLYVQGMLERRDGKILNVASTAGFVPGPLMAVYYASKAYVVSFSEALANELQGTGVTVTTLCPGPTATEFAAQADMLATKLFQGEVMDAAAVARAGYVGMMKGRGLVVPGLRNKLTVLASRLASPAFGAKVARRLHERA